MPPAFSRKREKNGKSKNATWQKVSREKILIIYTVSRYSCNQRTCFLPMARLIFFSTPSSSSSSSVEMPGTAGWDTEIQELAFVALYAHAYIRSSSFSLLPSFIISFPLSICAFSYASFSFWAKEKTTRKAKCERRIEGEGVVSKKRKGKKKKCIGPISFLEVVHRTELDDEIEFANKA